MFLNYAYEFLFYKSMSSVERSVINSRALSQECKVGQVEPVRLVWFCLICKLAFKLTSEVIKVSKNSSNI